MRTIAKCRKNTILIGLCRLNVVLFLLSGCMLDSESRIPCVAMLVSAAWLLIFLVANAERWGGEYEDY